MTQEANTPAAQETQPAAPAAPAAPTPAPAPVAPTVVAVSQTGDAAMDLALSEFVKAGVAADSLAMTMAKSGDFSLLRAELAGKGAEAYVAVAEQAHGRKVAAEKAAEEAATKVVVAVAGDPETWAKVKDFAASKATDAELADINASLKAGGVRAQAMAQYLVKVYEAANGAITPAGGERPDPNARAGGSAPSQALSPAEYAAAVRELAMKVGPGRVQATPEYAALQARRRMYRK